MATAIEFDNIGKQYRLGLVSTKTLSNDLQRWITVNILRKEDPFLTVGEINDRSTKGTSDYVWALKDISFKVEEGDVVGIIGKNGAGKSTLLKLLSRVTSPTTGQIRAKGRIASLLEVGTGFHSELTGRENIYMNGTILGMTKKEIDRKLDEIVDFSGCERYLDTPVKRYSSGMMVRLGFAVAAHLDPDVLVVDEVLAVGDAEFQKKAIGKMQDISHGAGRTVLFVSHNMTAIKSLCKRGIILKNGMLVEDGDVDSVVTKYLRGDSAISNHRVWNEDNIECKGGGFELLEIGVRKKEGNPEDVMRMSDELELFVKYRLVKDFPEFWLTFHFKDEQGNAIFSSCGGGRCYERQHVAGVYEQKCCVPANFLNWSNYSIDLMAVVTGGEHICDAFDVISFTIGNIPLELGGWMGKEPGFVTPKFQYTEKRIE